MAGAYCDLSVAVRGIDYPYGKLCSSPIYLYIVLGRKKYQRERLLDDGEVRETWRKVRLPVFISNIHYILVSIAESIRSYAWLMVLSSHHGLGPWSCLDRNNHQEAISMNTTRKFLKGFGQGARNFGQNLGAIINTVLLLIVYIIGVGVTSIVAKLFRKRFLETRLSKERKTYWSDLGLGKKQIESYYRQF